MQCEVNLTELNSYINYLQYPAINGNKKTDFEFMSNFLFKKPLLVLFSSAYRAKAINVLLLDALVSQHSSTLKT